jgi:hypothetical protein
VIVGLNSKYFVDALTIEEVTQLMNSIKPPNTRRVVIWREKFKREKVLPPVAGTA